MSRGTLTGILFFTWYLCQAQQVFSVERERVPVTYSVSVSSDKRPLPRIQARQDNQLVKIEAFYLPHLPSGFRGIRSTTPKKRISHGQMLAIADASLDSTYRLITESSVPVRFKLPAPAVFKRQKELFLDGKNAQPYLRHQWVQLAQFPGLLKSDYSFRIKRFLKKPIAYQVDYLPSSFAYKLPVLDPWKCGPTALRLFGLRKLQGYGVRALKSTRYQVTERETRRRNFDIYFRKNEAVPDAASVDEIISYLKKNDYVIVKAEMQGAASIEGSAERNKQLQEQRAAVIQKLFKEYNDNPVREDTLLLLDNFAPFRAQIRNTQYYWLDTLINSSLQKRINEDLKLMKNLEPYLKTQRKATLRLIMAKKNSMEEQIGQMEDIMTRMMRVLAQNKFAEGEAQAKLMGVMEYLMELYRREQITKERLLKLLDGSPNADYLYILAGYSLIRQFDAFDQRKKYDQWNLFWNKYGVKALLVRAQQGAVAMAGQANDHKARLKYVSMCVDFQAYSYRFIDLKLMTAGELCEVPYPNNPIFTGLQLNQYAFLYERAQQGDPVTCFSAAPSDYQRRDTTATTDEQLQQIRKEIGVVASELRGGQLFLKPIFDMEPKSAYYELLKSYYVKGDKQVMEWVQYTDGGKPELNVFNLYHLLQQSLDAFDPFRNHFYDEEVQLVEMEKLIGQLKRMDSHLCKPQANGLYLDYHLKALYYLQRYADPGDERLTRIAESALDFIADYYRKRAPEISSDLSQHITGQLNAFNELPGSKAGAAYAHDILNAIASKRMLQGDELKRYAHYIKMYNPEMKGLSKMYDKEKLQQLSLEQFK